MSERVILAYSGGLDTSVAISWIGKETGKEVVAVAIDLGQGGDDGGQTARRRIRDEVVSGRANARDVHDEGDECKYEPVAVEGRGRRRGRSGGGRGHVVDTVCVGRNTV